jgi:hypothetical protein
MLDKIIRVLAYLVSLLLLSIAVTWMIDPSKAAGDLGMPLLDGVGRSTQVGDLAAFFAVAGIFGLWGLISKNRFLLYAPAALVGFAALFRTLAFLLHDAALATQIGPEIVMLVIYILASRKLQE